jgi:hypothetical protein
MDVYFVAIMGAAALSAVLLFLAVLGFARTN